MTNTNTRNVLDDAVDFILSHFAAEGIYVGRAHSHALVAHFLGYSSKIALKSADDFDLYDVELITDFGDADIGKMREHIARMQSNPFQNMDVHDLADVVEAGLKPACEVCSTKGLDVRFVGTDAEKPDGWVCFACTDEHPSNYAFCKFCGDGRPHYASDINSGGECELHAGESSYSDEEIEDINSYVEYIQNH